MKDITDIIVAVVVLFIIIVLGLSFYKTGKNSEYFKATCIEAKGKPVYNGRNWECIK